MSTTDATTKPAPPTTDRAPMNDEPLTRRRRIRAWATAALRDLVYAAAIFAWSIAAFTILVTGVSLTASLIVFIAGVFVWVGFVYVVRWTTWVDRRLAGWQRHERLTAAYRRPPANGFLPLLKTVSADPQTWRDLGWLGLTSIVGFTLGLVAITAMGVVVAYLSMPIWYWAISDPEGQFGLTNLGLFSADTLGEAVAVAAIGLALAPLALLLARGCATAHAAVAARILRPSPHARRGSLEDPHKVRAMSPPSATTQSMRAPAGPDQAVGRHDNLTARAARWSAAHRKAAVLGWLAFVLVTFAIGSAAGFVFMKDEEFGIGDSHGAEKVLAREFPTERAAEQMLIQSRGGRLDRAQLSAAVDDLVVRLSRVRAVAAIESPLDADNAGQVSPDGRSALVTFQIKGDPDTAQDRVDPALAAAAAVQRAHPELLIGEVGHGSINKAMSERLAADFQRAEVTSLPVTLVILMLAFGALVAAGIPLLLGLTAVMGALGLTALFSHLLHVEESINSVILLIGLFLFVVLFGLSMDYHVLILSRVREAHDAGMPTARAVDHGIRATASVVTSAAIVMVGVFAIFATLGWIDFKMMGVGLAVAVFLDATIVRAVLLPATMALLGDWNWYLPRWLQWLPRISHEPPATPTDTKHETRIPAGA